MRTIGVKVAGAEKVRSDDIIPAAVASTLADVFRERLRRTPHATAYREFDTIACEWRDYSWSAIDGRVSRVCAAFAAADLKPGDRVAIAVPNGTDWVSFDIAALTYGLVVVPLYLHDSPANMAFILAHAEARLLLVDSKAQWRALLPHWPNLIQLAHVWIRDTLEAEDADLSRPGLRPLADVLEPGATVAPYPSISPEAVATIIYTSGTTGRPKGVMLTHRALVWNASAVARIIPPYRDDVFLSCLPLAHAFERTVGYYLPMIAGCTVAYARSIDTLAQDFTTLRPSVFLGVPRIYERALAAIRARAKRNLVKRLLLEVTIRTGWKRFLVQQNPSSSLTSLDQLLWRALCRLVGTKVRAAFGGQLRVAVSGGATLPLDVARSLIGLGVPIIEGYGLTEAGPVVAANSLNDNQPGSVGRPLDGVEVKKSTRGELLVRSPSVMKGYWKDESLTRDTVDQNGWLHTGDLAVVENGRVFIRGRQKELIVLSTGEKVSPADIEAILMHDPLFEQALVVGEGRPFLVAILSLTADAWLELANKLAVPEGDPNHGIIQAEVLRRLNDRMRDKPRHAKIRAVYLTLDRWTVANGLLTPTLKTKRTPLTEKYASRIAGLYAAHERATRQ